MTSVEQAKQFAEENFPHGPEKLAEKMGIEVRESVLVGCDGWVLSGPDGIVICLNSKSPVQRRRFTLAHELGHLPLNVPTVVGESIYDVLKSNDHEERAVNLLAGELLIPESIVRRLLPSTPVVASQLTKLAKHAKVSELAAAIRVVHLAAEIGLENAAVVYFKGDVYQWFFSKTLKIKEEWATHLFKEAKRTKPNPIRLPNGDLDDSVIVASIIENPLLNLSTLFVQLLSCEAGSKSTPEEVRRQLEAFLFSGDAHFRNQMQGVFGYFRPKCKNMTLNDAVSEFFTTKIHLWQGEQLMRLLSVEGRKYVRMRLSEWCET